MARFRRSIRLAAAAAPLVIASLLAVPASALDDDGKKNIFSSVGELFTMGDQSSRDIQYRDRAPLVIPPSIQQLPPPRPSAATDAGWMHDRKASGRRNPVAVARSADPDRGTLTEPPNDYFRKAGNKPLPADEGSKGMINGFLSSINPWKDKDE